MSDNLVSVAVRAIGYAALYVHNNLKKQNNLNGVVALPPTSIYRPNINFYKKWTWIGDPVNDLMNHANKNDSVQYLADRCNKARFYLLYINTSVYFKREYGIHGYLFRLFIKYEENYR